jgi:hypothetical protein
LTGQRGSTAENNRNLRVAESQRSEERYEVGKRQKVLDDQACFALLSFFSASLRFAFLL